MSIALGHFCVNLLSFKGGGFIFFTNNLIQWNNQIIYNTRLINAFDAFQREKSQFV